MSLATRQSFVELISLVLLESFLPFYGADMVLRRFKRGFAL